jgi:hypothetical protein
MSAKSKIDWTHELWTLANGQDARFPNINQKNTIILYWYNTNKNFGFRLNGTGFDLLFSAGYKFYEHHLDVKKFPIHGNELVLMDRYHMNPWFYRMSKGELFLMDGELSSILLLCDNNLKQAIQILS